MYTSVVLQGDSRMKSPNIFISWLIGLILPLFLFGGLFLTNYISSTLLRLIAILMVLCVSGGVLFGEMIHIHRKLNKIESEQEDDEDYDTDNNERRTRK